MAAIIILLGIVFVAAMANNASLFTIGLVMLFGYTIFSFSQKKPSVVKLTESKSSTSLLDALDKVQLKNPEGVVDEMLKDLGKITGHIAKNKNAELNGKAILKSTHKVIEDATSVFK